MVLSRLPKKTAGSNDAKCDAVAATDSKRMLFEIASSTGRKEKKSRGARGVRVVEGQKRKGKNRAETEGALWRECSVRSRWKTGKVPSVERRICPASGLAGWGKPSPKRPTQAQ